MAGFKATGRRDSVGQNLPSCLFPPWVDMSALSKLTWKRELVEEHRVTNLKKTNFLPALFLLCVILKRRNGGIATIMLASSASKLTCILLD